MLSIYFKNIIYKIFCINEFIIFWICFIIIWLNFFFDFIVNWNSYHEIFEFWFFTCGFLYDNLMFIYSEFLLLSIEDFYILYELAVFFYYILDAIYPEFEFLLYTCFYNYLQIYFWVFVINLLYCSIFIKKYEFFLLKKISVYYFSFVLLFFLCILVFFQLFFNNCVYYFFEYKFYLFNVFNINFFFILDYISLFFVLLTCLLFYLTILLSLNNIKYNFKFFFLNLIVLEFFIILMFLTSNFFYFYLFFELSIFSMFFIIGVWGSRQRKIFALYQFFFYTIVGSVCLLSSILLFYISFGTIDFSILLNYNISYERQLLLWLLVFLGFSTKIPLVPFHVWLPEAHVEAPTSGSVILAGILLKLGTYGLFRFLIPLCPFANFFYLPLIYTLCFSSIIYISFIILTQIDLKKIIAYSSILHMNFIILGLFSFTFIGVIGSIFLMISHGLISSALFICVGILYDRYKTRNFLYYGGLVDFMPLFAIFFFIIILSNLGFPLSSNFIGEVFVCLGLIEDNFFLTFILINFTFFGALYSIWLYNKIIFGTNKYLIQVSDISEKEFFILFILVLLILILGIKPMFLLKLFEDQLYLYLEYLKY